MVSGAVTACSDVSAQENSHAYPALLSAQDQATIAYRDTLRPLDPCGYFDDAAVQPIGTPDYVGAFGDFSECEASFEPADGRRSWITVNMYPHLPDTPLLHPIGELWDSSESDCDGAAVAVDDRMDITVQASVYDRDGRQIHPCPVVRDIARAAVRHWSERPLRASSRRAHMNSRLATLDPCAVLGAVGQGHHPALVADDGPKPSAQPALGYNANPWECAFLLDTGDVSTFQDIRYKFGSDDFERNVGGDRKAVTIGGLRALEKSEPGPDNAARPCVIDLSTSPQPAGPGRDRHNVVDTYSNEIISIEARNGCAAARATAEELVRLYSQLPR